ncbi:hypothetical protein P3573_07075 [Vibrio parahaemolyticus]|nr:hypothetical protein [Vibrio parahaemolyticus]
MMNNISYLHGWQKRLCVTLKDGNNCDFNRFLYLHCPSTTDVQQGKKQSANRDATVLLLYERLSSYLTEGGSQATVLFIYVNVFRYMRWLDQRDIQAFTQDSVNAYTEYLYQRTLRKEIKRNTYVNMRSALVQAFRHIDLPDKWFEHVPLVPKDDIEPFQAYSQSDLTQLLPFLRSLFKQTSTQLLADPQKHMSASHRAHSMNFNWKGTTYKIHSGIRKMMVSATYLLAYYTYANTTQLLNLPRPKLVSKSTRDIWYSMPAFKRRAFKIIHVEMGSHQLDIPKYSMQFFDKLLRVSQIIDSSDTALLLQTRNQNKLSSLTSSSLNGFNSWLRKHFNFIDEQGQALTPVISRFRETGSQLTSYYQGDIAQGIVLDSTPTVRKKHYSTGNPYSNQAMTQEAALIRQEQAASKSSAKEAQRTLQIEVLTIDQEHRIAFPNLSRSAHGSHCKEPFGEKSQKFNRKANQHKLTQGEKLACAELLDCFGCPEQVIVQSVSDIWCLLSFKECIEESMYLHLDAHHFKRNFEKTVSFIDAHILPRLDKNIVRQAEVKLDMVGRHPLWQEAESIIPNITIRKGNSDE